MEIANRLQALQKNMKVLNSIDKTIERSSHHKGTGMIHCGSVLNHVSDDSHHRMISFSHKLTEIDGEIIQKWLVPINPFHNLHTKINVVYWLYKC